MQTDAWLRTAAALWMKHLRATLGTEAILLTVVGVVPATAIAANVLNLFADVTVDGKGHVVVVVVLRLQPGPLLAAQRHYSHQAERFFLRLLRRHGCVFSAPRGEPSAAHEDGRGVDCGVIGRLEHRGRGDECGASRCYGSVLSNERAHHQLSST